MKGPSTAAAGTVLAFFVAIGEMILMVSPFGAYFYGVYSPFLTFLGSSSWLSWLPEFWVSHIAPRGLLTPVVHGIGLALAVTGLALFAVHAAYLYGIKFRHRAVARRLLYGRVRHPQYTCLILAGIGLALLWPRFINLVLLLAMMGAYGLLARAEEARMRRSFPLDYEEYARGKPRFIPGRWVEPALHRAASWIPVPRLRAPALAFLLCAVVLGGAFLVREVSIRSLSTIPVAASGLIIAYSPLPEGLLRVAEDLVTADTTAAPPVRLLYVTEDRRTLDHLLIDSGVRHAAVESLDMPDDAFYIVRARATAASARDALRPGVARRLDGVFWVASGPDGLSATEAALPDGAAYGHASVPAL